MYYSNNRYYVSMTTRYWEIIIITFQSTVSRYHPSILSGLLLHNSGFVGLRILEVPIIHSDLNNVANEC